MLGLRVGRAGRGLPAARDPSMPLLPWTVALLVYLATLGGAGLLLVGEVLQAAEQSVAARLSVELPPQTSEARLQTAVALLRQTPGVAAADLLSPADTARLLEPWLGSPLRLEDLPVPRLIDVRLEPHASLELPALRRQLASVVPDARIDDHGSWTGGLHAAARPIRAVLALLIGAAAALCALAATAAGRAAIAARQSRIELFHALGADDGDIGRPFAWRALRLGLLGGGAGGLAALLTVAALKPAGGLVVPAAPVAGTGLGDWRLWLIALAAALAAGGIAAAAAQLAALRRLARLP